MTRAFFRAGIRLALAALLLAGLGGRAVQAERRVALVVGNGDYVHAPKLDTPANDAKLISATLQLLGFTVIGGGALIDLDRPSFERMVRDFGRAIEPGTVALFYYAGLGLQIGGTNYLAPVQANLTGPSDADFELINLDVVVRQMDAANSGLNLLMLDAARANPFGGHGLPDASGGLAAMQPPRRTLISFAAQPGRVAREGDPNGDSAYAVALAKALKTPGIDIVKALGEVGLEVSRSTGGSQVPWLSAAAAEGAVYLVSAPADVAKAEPPTQPPTMLIYPPTPAAPTPAAPTPAAPTSGPATSGPATPEPPAAPAPVVAIGADQFSEAQRLVLAMGISRAAVTGRPDPRLSEALRIFQRAAKQPETGVLTAALLEALRLPQPDVAARSDAVFGFAGEAARGGRTGDAVALYEEGLRLDPGNAGAQHALAELRKPPPRPVVQRPPPVPEPPPRRAVPPPEPPAAGFGYAATAMNLRGQQFRAGAGSEAAAVSSALAMCHAASWECRIVGMSGPAR